MNEDLTLRSMLDSILDNILVGITDFVPRTLVALVVVIIGWLFAKIIRRSLRVMLTRVHFDQALERIGIGDALGRIGLHDKPSRLIPNIIFYLIVIFVLKVASQSAGLTEIANAINSALAFVPNVVAALVIVLVGTVVGQFAGNAVASSAKNAGIDYSSILGKLTSSLVLFVVMILAVAQLRINMEIINSVVLIVFAGFGLCFALSFGLGTREITRNIVTGFYARRAFKIGDEVEISGERGIIKAFTPLVTLLERDNLSVAVSNSAFLGSAGKR
ncbi:MAG: mechanosensitive ion channel [Candidatus Krumholzibacteria bacterium]|nr:mechanosensitive ion channel [Candidatus Krumholzibacteria bacterium]